LTSVSRMRLRHNSQVLALLLVAFAALLVFAGPAAAETLTGETTGPAGTGTEPEAEIASAKASYDKSAGAVGFTIITKAEPQEEVEGASSPLIAAAYLVNRESGCSIATLGESPGFPSFEIEGEFATREAKGILGTSSASPPVEIEPATMTVSGTTTSLSATNPQLANLSLNCAVVFLEGAGAPEPVVFPISVPSAPAATTTPTPTAPAPTPTAAFSLAKIKTLTAKEDKWTKVNVKVTNTGNAAVGPVAIKAKAPKGIVLQPASGSLKLPALLAGQTWTVTFKVKLTSKAKKSSTISLTTSSGAISAAGSFVLKRAG
jgi:hypothetical protein